VIQGLFVILLLALWVLPPERRGLQNQ
jgi:hypothetical protein